MKKVTPLLLAVFLAISTLLIIAPVSAISSPPIADAGPDQIVEQTSHAGADVTLDASGSSDPDGDPLTYSWSWTGGGSATGVNPTATFPLGTTTVTLTVDDGILADTDEVDITVVDTTPPDITVSLSKDMLWPPNHKYKTITATVTVTDICDPSPIFMLVSITSNEPDNGIGIGDGNTVNDIAEADIGTPDDIFKLRAERAELGTGRVYTITYEAIDASGNTAQASATVTIPVGK
jgi:hypothetical protein